MSVLDVSIALLIAQVGRCFDASTTLEASFVTRSFSQAACTAGIQNRCFYFQTRF